MEKNLTKPFDTQDLQSLVDKAILWEKEQENNANKVKEIIAKSNYKTRRKRRIRQMIAYPLLSIAGVLLLFILIDSPFIITPEMFYQESFNPVIRESIYRGENLNQNETSTAITSVADLFILVKTAMGKENWEQAENILIPLLEKGGSIEIESLWHLSLITSQTKDHKACKKYLDRILESNDPTYRSEAKKLLRIINVR